MGLMHFGPQGGGGREGMEGVQCYRHALCTKKKMQRWRPEGHHAGGRRRESTGLASWLGGQIPRGASGGGVGSGHWGSPPCC